MLEGPESCCAETDVYGVCIGSGVCMEMEVGTEGRCESDASPLPRWKSLQWVGG